MFTKRTITLAALLIAGATTAAFAYEAPENKIGDRYPLLEQQYQPTSTNNVRTMTAPKTQRLDQYINEDVENKIGDRYPLLEQPVRVSSVAQKGTAKTMRSVKSFTFAEKAQFDFQSARAVF